LPLVFLLRVLFVLLSESDSLSEGDDVVTVDSEDDDETLFAFFFEVFFLLLGLDPAARILCSMC